MKRFREITLLSGIVAFLAGCATVQERNVETLQSLPDEYADESLPATLSDVDQWWLVLESEQLDTLMDRVLTGNLDLQTAWARLRQAEAALKGSNAALYPSVSASLSGAESEFNIGEDSSFSTSEYSGSLSVSYEVDIWGKIKSSAAASKAQAAASAYDLEATAWTITAAVARTWVELQQATVQLDLLVEQLGNNQKQYDLIESRYAYGSSNALDLAQQKKTLATAQAAIPSQEKQVALLRQQLAILLGLPADTELELEFESQFSEAYPDISVGVPVDLLKRRPDVRSVEMSLEAADWNVVNAKAARWPSLSITGTASDSADGIGDLFDSWGASLIGNLTAPLFDAGARKSEVERQLAAAEIALLNYRSNVLSAHQEVVEAMVSMHYDKRYLEAQQLKLEASEAAYRESDYRYLNGSSEYINVISSLNDFQSSQRDYLSAQANVWTDVINLIVATGGPIVTQAGDETPQNYEF